ncbi:MAG: hypothetical protein WCO82_01125 [Sphingomonadales bacterium]
MPGLGGSNLRRSRCQHPVFAGSNVSHFGLAVQNRHAADADKGGIDAAIKRALALAARKIQIRQFDAHHHGLTALGVAGLRNCRPGDHGDCQQRAGDKIVGHRFLLNGWDDLDARIVTTMQQECHKPVMQES